MKLFFGFAALAALIVAFILILLIRPVQTPLIVLAASLYEESHPGFPAVRFPRNLWAEEDLQFLAGAEYDNLAVGRPHSERRLDQDRFLFALQEALEAARPGGPGKDVVTAYFSFHTAVNSEGEPCILTSEATVFNEASWLSFTRFLETLQEIQPDAKKVVFFDCGRVSMDPSLGILNPGFVKRASEVVGRNPPKNVWILFSHSDGERTWTTPELGNTPFAYFVAEGLRGAADRNRDRKVSLRELQEYVRFQTNEFVRDRLDATQHPLLAGVDADSDFPLVHVTGADPRQPQADPALAKRVNERLEKLHRLDERLDRTLKSVGENQRRFSPTRYSDLLAARDELEAWLTAGLLSVSDSEWNQRHSEAEESLRNLSESIPGETIYPASLAELERSGRIDGTTVQRIMQQIDSGIETSELDRQGSPAEIAAAAWRRLVQLASREGILTREDLQRSVGALQRQNAPPLVEAQFTALLHAWIDWDAALPELGRTVAQAVLCRDLSRRAARFGDPRVFDWVREELEAAAKVQREAEDLLFVGSPPALEQARTGFTRAREAYERLLATSRSVEEALHFRDLAIQQLLGSPASVWELLEPEFSLWSAEIRDMDRILSQQPYRLDPLRAAFSQAQRTWQRLSRQVSVQAAAFGSSPVSAGVDAPSRQRILSFLQIPFLDPGDRDALRKRLVHAALQHEAVGTAWEPTGSEAQAQVRRADHPAQVSDAFAVQLEWLESAGLDEGKSEGTLLAPIGGELKESDLEWRLNRQGRLYRDFLRRVPGRLQSLTEFTGPTGEIDRGTAETRLAEADRLIRIVAPQRGFSMLRASVSDRQPPVQRLGALIQTRLALWKTEQTLHDFWGPTLIGSSRAPFFEATALKQLDAARTGLSRSDQGFLQDDVARVQELLGARKDAAASLVHPSCEDMQIWTDPNRETDRSPVPMQHRISLNQAADAARPGGTAFVTVQSRSDRREILPLEEAGRRAAIPVGSATASSSFFLNGTQEQFLRWEGGELVTFFRGHTRSAPFRVHQSVERSLDLQFESPATVPPPRLTVLGESKVKPVIMLILDCSGSMYVEDVAEDPRAPKMSRMDAARNALRRLVRRLPEGEFLLGLMAYGHRYRFERTLDNIVDSPFVQSDYYRTRFRPGDRHPNRDIQLLIPPRLTSDRLALEVEEAAGLFRNWGQTPLYASIREALQHLNQPQFAGQPRHVIVISDGMNHIAGDPTSTDVLRKDLEPILRRNPNVKIDVIGIGAEFEEERRTRSDEYRNLEALMAVADGRIHFVTDVSSLLDRLERSLELVHFTLARQGEAVQGERQKHQLGSTWTLPGPDALPARFEATLHGLGEEQSRTVEFKGGEHLRLYLDSVIRDGGRERLLRHHRYGPGEDEIRDAIEVERSSDEGTLVAAHQSRRAGTEVTFRVSFQNRDADRFSPRPELVLARITPIEEGDAVRKHEPYWLYDFAFEPDKPVPLVPFTVPDWPARAERSRIDLVFAHEQVTPDYQSRLDAVDTPLRIPELPETLFVFEYDADEEGRFRLVITEEHHARGRLEMAAAEFKALVWTVPPPQRVTRRYFQTSNKIQHVFEYGPRTGALNPEVRILTEKKLSQFAHRTPRPLEIVVPRR